MSISAPPSLKRIEDALKDIRSEIEALDRKPAAAHANGAATNHKAEA